MARPTRTFFLLALLVCALLAPEAGATHVKCGSTLTQDTTLDGDLFCPSNAVLIGADGVTFNLGGHVLSGEETEENPVAIEVRPGVDGAHVRNGAIEGFSYGMEVFQNAGLRVHDIRFRKLGRAIQAGDVTDARIFGNRFEGPGIHAGGEVLIARNRFDDGEIHVGGGGRVVENTISHGNISVAGGIARVLRNRISDGTIQFVQNSGGIARANRIVGGETGVLLQDSAEPRVVGNTIQGQSGDGIRYDGRFYSDFSNPPDTVPAILTGNSVRDTGGDGIEITGGACAIVAGNTVRRAAESGIELGEVGHPDGSCIGPDARQRATNNHVHHNAQDGIVVHDNWAPVLLERNRAEQNGDDGIDVGPLGAVYSDPDWSPDGGLVALRAAAAAGSPSIWLAAPGGSDATRLTEGSQPDWSPDGARIAFTRADGIYVIDSDGANLRRLTDSGNTPQWNPAGNALLFERGRALWTIAAAGGTPTRLTEGTGAEWSPDGQRIAFSNRTDAFVMRSDGSEVTFLLEGAQPSWSPDGERIVFTDGVHLVSITPTGGGQRTLTTGDATDFEPSWSPDSEPIAFLSGTTRFNTSIVDVFSIPSDGTDLRRLTGPTAATDESHLKSDLSWSPAGDRLMFESDADVVVVDADGMGAERITLDVNPLVTLTANGADRNRDLGIEAVEQVKDGGGNRARGNGDPRQCVGVACG